MMMAAIVNSTYLGFSHYAHKLWLKLIQSDWNSFTLTRPDNASHLEFYHLGFTHFAQIKTSLIHSDSIWVMAYHLEFWHAGSQPLPSWIQTKLVTHSSQIQHQNGSSSLPLWPSWTQTYCISDFKLIHSALNLMISAILNSTCLGFSHFEQKKHQSFILTQLWWWQPSWSPLCWIWPFCFQTF